jgi:ADP-ribosylglycohydrolase
VLNWKKSGLSWEEAISNIHDEYDEKISINLTHTITNEMIVCIALLYGEMDLGKSICIAVEGAFDTDCNGATVGSIVGLANGAKALPTNWIEPFHDTLKSGVDGFGMVKISELAERTVKILNNNINR